MGLKQKNESYSFILFFTSFLLTMDAYVTRVPVSLGSRCSCDFRLLEPGLLLSVNA